MPIPNHCVECDKPVTNGEILKKELVLVCDTCIEKEDDIKICDECGEAPTMCRCDMEKENE